MLNVSCSAYAEASADRQAIPKYHALATGRLFPLATKGLPTVALK